VETYTQKNLKSDGKEAPVRITPIQTLQAVVFGLTFGFLLQRGGLGYYDVLENQLLLQDFTVVKVMLTAILVGMIGVHLLNKFAGTKMHIPPMRIAANVLGGLIFGVGFALAGYCPGTAVVALGQGAVSAVVFMLGMVTGSYLYAELSKALKASIETRGVREELTFPELFHIRTGTFIGAFTVLLLVVLFVLNEL
jgi:uncharacterized protein